MLCSKKMGSMEAWLENRRQSMYSMSLLVKSSGSGKTNVMRCAFALEDSSKVTDAPVFADEDGAAVTGSGVD